MKTVMRQMGPGMYSQSTGPCDDCNGQGEMIDPKKRCKKCKGKKVNKEKKNVKVEMDKGSPSGEQFTVHGEGNQIPEAEPGDVIVVIKVKPSKAFTRKGADLYMDKEITLLEALTGVSFNLVHLDGRVIRIENKAGQIVSPN
jgi:DnaJ family protein A protein 2